MLYGSCDWGGEAVLCVEIFQGQRTGRMTLSSVVQARSVIPLLYLHRGSSQESKKRLRIKEHNKETTPRRPPVMTWVGHLSAALRAVFRPAILALSSILSMASARK